MRDTRPDATRTSWLGRVSSIARKPLVIDVFDSASRVVEVNSSIALQPDSYVEVTAGDGEPTVCAIVAASGSARAAVYDVAVGADLDPSFPRRIDEEVAVLLADPGLDDPILKDLTALPFVTIDGAHTRDLDQAMFIEEKGCGHVVWYALADASFYVRPGMALFEEAVRRGASFYLPGLVVPMLPRALSEGLISLNENTTRRATVFRMELGSDGTCTQTDLVRAKIRSRAKLTFEQVQSYFDAPDRSGLRTMPFATSLDGLRDVGSRRILESTRRDVVRYQRSEVDVGLDGEDGLRFVVLDDLRWDVERYNEQLSLLCNIEGARLLAGGNGKAVQPIYRVHPPPREDRIEELERLLPELASYHGLDPASWAWNSGCCTSLAAYLASLPTTGPAAAVAKAIHRQAILLNLRSSFSEKPGEHYGVGADLYARFSSPMREIVGVFLHKEAWEKSCGPLAPRWSIPMLPVPDDDDLRRRIVRSANRSKDQQKELDKACNRLVIDRMFARDLALPGGDRPVREGTIMGLTRSKAHVLLDEPHLDVNVYAPHLAEQRGAGVLMSPAGAAWLDDGGRVVLRLGDRVRVRLRAREAGSGLWVLGIS